MTGPAKTGKNFVTVVLPFARQSEWNPLLEGDVVRLLEPLGNPLADDLRARIDALGIVHFFSVNVIGATPDDPKSFVLIEASVDGETGPAIDAWAGALGEELLPALSLACGIEHKAEIAPLMRRHVWRLSNNPIRLPRTIAGLPFDGVQGLTVKQILAHRDIAEFAQARIDRLRNDVPIMGPQNTFRRVALDIANAGHLADQRGIAAGSLVFSETGDAPWVTRERERRPLEPVREFLGVAAQWLHLVLLGPLLVSFGLVAWADDLFPARATLDWAAELATAVMIAIFPAILFVILLAVLLILLLRRAERANTPRDLDPVPSTMAAMMARENDPAGHQNHMISVTVLQKGLIRRLAICIAFTTVLFAARMGLMRSGFLATVGTIHSARFMVLPGTRRHVFVSNYDGSWESYLEDFITKAALGTTGIWSNCEGFPKTSLLFWKGAADGDRMKRFARHSMQPTAVWYSAYPRLTCDQARRQALIANGFKNRGMVGDSASAAEAWLALFGSVPRPEFALEYDEIQALMFGGLKHHTHGRCLAIGFGPPSAATVEAPHPYAHVQRWLTGLKVTFGDLPPPALVRNVAFSAQGLRKLGLESELSLDPPRPEAPGEVAPPAFPAVFSMGMGHRSRKRLLRDPEQLEWCDDTADAVLLLYSGEENWREQFDLAARRIGDAGLEVLRSIDTRLVPFDGRGFEARWNGADKAAGAEQAGTDLTAEPFGFVDGISQPRVRGFPGRQGTPDPIHSVEPGEFILGYADNRGHVPPSPHIARRMGELGMEPETILPATSAETPQRFPDFRQGSAPRDEASPCVRDFGRNGSYLVIRELAQDVAGFEAQASRFADQLCAKRGQPDHQADPLNPHPDSHVRTAEWVAAKMVGRWRNGSPLAECPHEPSFASATREDTGNSFLFRDVDPQGVRCPFGSHIRRAFPRDSLDPNLAEELPVSNRHRLLRRGRPFIGEDDQPAGTLFMCFNADLERQFEFVQQNWLNAPGFHGLAGEADPCATASGPAMIQATGRSPGDGAEPVQSFTIPGSAIPLRLEPLKSYVSLKGGGYFFMPGRHALWFLSGQPWLASARSEQLHLPPM